MKIHRSAGLGSEYVVYRSDTKEIVPDVVVVIPENDMDSVVLLNKLGFHAWAQMIGRNLQDMKELDGNDG